MSSDSGRWKIHQNHVWKCSAVKYQFQLTTQTGQIQVTQNIISIEKFPKLQSHVRTFVLWQSYNVMLAQHVMKPATDVTARMAVFHYQNLSFQKNSLSRANLSEKSSTKSYNISTLSEQCPLEPTYQKSPLGTSFKNLRFSLRTRLLYVPWISSVRLGHKSSNIM